jgi:hypothetical protein
MIRGSWRQLKNALFLRAKPVLEELESNVCIILFLEQMAAWPHQLTMGSFKYLILNQGLSIHGVQKPGSHFVKFFLSQVIYDLYKYIQ